MITELKEKKPREKHDVDALLEKAKWRNYAFGKDGKSYRSSETHNSEESAREAICRNEQTLGNDRPYFITMDGRLLKQDYHYAMPMPELV